MAKDKKSFIAYADWKETFDNLPDEYAGKLIKHIFAYVNDENPITDDLVIKAVFPNIKNTLKRDLEKWENQLEQRREAGRKSAELRKAKSNDRSISYNEPTRNPTVNDNVSVSVSVSDKNKEDISFDEFWDLYDKKVSREKAEKKWNTLSAKDKELIMQFIPKYKEYQPDKKFRKDPTTFFNNKTWLDELPTKNGIVSILGETEEEKFLRIRMHDHQNIRIH